MREISLINFEKFFATPLSRKFVPLSTSFGVHRIMSRQEPFSIDVLSLKRNLFKAKAKIAVWSLSSSSLVVTVIRHDELLTGSRGRLTILAVVAEEVDVVTNVGRS